MGPILKSSNLGIPACRCVKTYIYRSIWSGLGSREEGPPSNTKSFADPSVTTAMTSGLTGMRSGYAAMVTDASM